jgi:hypothetical protein
MNRLAVILASMAVFAVAFAYPYGDPGQAAQTLIGSFSNIGIGPPVQYAQYYPPGIFDRGSCELNCRDRFRDTSSWTRDNQQSGSSADYLRCTTQCATRDLNELERSRSRY